MKTARSTRYLILIVLLLSVALLGSRCGSSSDSNSEAEESSPIGVRISSPSNGTTFIVGEMVPFEAQYKLNEHEFTVVWNSDVTGDFYTEEYLSDPWYPDLWRTHAFNSSALSAGTHVVTCTVTDVDGHTGKASITITIEEEEPVYTPFTRASISFNTVNWLEHSSTEIENDEEDDETADNDIDDMIGGYSTNGTSLSDRGHQGIFSGNTYTLDFETIDFYSQVRTIIEITIVLNDSHDVIENVDFYRTEDDEDVASCYTLSEHFSASNIPRTSSSSDRLVFRLDGMGVCNAIEDYQYVQIKNENYQRRESIDHCEENSWLQVVLFQ